MADENKSGKGNENIKNVIDLAVAAREHKSQEPRTSAVSGPD